MSLEDEVRAFVQTHTALPKTRSLIGEDILAECRIAGDDGEELFQDYADVFKVDLSQLRLEFHFDRDEPPMGRYKLVGPDGAPAPYIPVTLEDLVRGARDGTLRYDYGGLSLVTSVGWRIMWVVIVAIPVALLAAGLWLVAMR